MSGFSTSYNNRTSAPAVSPSLVSGTDNRSMSISNTSQAKQLSSATFNANSTAPDTPLANRSVSSTTVSNVFTSTARKTSSSIENPSNTENSTLKKQIEAQNSILKNPSLDYKGKAEACGKLANLWKQKASNEKSRQSTLTEKMNSLEQKLQGTKGKDKKGIEKQLKDVQQELEESKNCQKESNKNAYRFHKRAYSNEKQMDNEAKLLNLQKREKELENQLKEIDSKIETLGKQPEIKNLGATSQKENKDKELRSLRKERDKLTEKMTQNKDDLGKLKEAFEKYEKDETLFSKQDKAARKNIINVGETKSTYIKKTLENKFAAVDKKKAELQSKANEWDEKIEEATDLGAKYYEKLNDWDEDHADERDGYYSSSDSDSIDDVARKSRNNFKRMEERHGKKAECYEEMAKIEKKRGDALQKEIETLGKNFDDGNRISGYPRDSMKIDLEKCKNDLATCKEAQDEFSSIAKEARESEKKACEAKKNISDWYTPKASLSIKGPGSASVAAGIAIAGAVGACVLVGIGLPIVAGIVGIGIGIAGVVTCVNTIANHFKSKPPSDKKQEDSLQKAFEIYPCSASESSSDWERW